MLPSNDKLEDAVTGQCEMVLVPRVPTDNMLRAAQDAAWAEDAAQVWSSMVEEWRSSSQQVKFGSK
jgi:hypothetical protein